MRHDGSINKFYHGMDNRFRVDDDVNLSGFDSKEPVGFDNFQPLIDQRCGVDGDSSAHPPDGMLQRLFGCDRVKVAAGEF